MASDIDKNGIVGGDIFNSPAPDLPDKYKYPQKLYDLQTDPKQMKTIDFKQDYTVIVRKKKYYAINQNNNELYVRVYQINNFTNISTTITTSGNTPGTCTVAMKGAERVVCADKNQIDSAKWSNFQSLMNSWNSDQGGQDSTTVNGVDYQNLMDSRLYKYGWKYAEKCDWEPMDEIYIFGKSKVAKTNGANPDYKFVQIFFGYITTVQKNYTAQGGPTITIQAQDMLKLLQISQMSDRPPLDMEVGGVGVRYDGYGNMIIEDNPTELVNTYTNFFAGAYVYEIIKSCCIGAGVPIANTLARIEPIMHVPFTPQINSNFVELFNGNWNSRLSYCMNAANICNLEFFADEQGNIVLKIPSYKVGINRLPSNFEGDQYTTNPDLLAVKTETDYEIIKQPIYKDVTSPSPPPTQPTPIDYTVKQGDDLWDIAKKYLGDALKWKQIWDQNKSHLKSKDPHWIYPGEHLIIYPPNNGLSNSFTTQDTGDLTYVVKPGDNLWDLAKRFLGNATLWRQIWNLNASTLKSGNPNLVYPGEKLIIKKGSGSGKTTQVLTGYKKIKKAITKQVPTNLPNQNDYLIRIIKPEEIISFTLTDTDQNVYTAVSVTQDVPFLNASLSSVPPATTRTVQDFNLIRQFGLRFMPAVNTPLVGGPTQAANYAGLLLLRSISQRYSGSITMIEESTIRVGDPIRFFPYDEHPFTELVDNTIDPYQAVYYVESISRSINPSGVSTMTLTLSAGREYGMESIYDNCQELYRYFYEEVQTNPQTSSTNAKKAAAATTTAKQTTTKTYVVQKGDSLWSIAQKEYGDGNKWQTIWNANSKANGGNLAKPNLLYPGTTLKIPPA